MLTPKEMALVCAKALDSKKGKDIRVIAVDHLTAMVDYFVICSGGSNTQINALSNAVEEALEKEGEQPLHREGYRGGTWVLLDYGTVAVHVFNQEAREFYSLERLWQDGTTLDISDITTED